MTPRPAPARVPRPCSAPSSFAPVLFRPVPLRPVLRRFAPALCGLALLVSSVGCATNRAGNGALAGSLIGAAAGAAIGEAGDNPLAGALIGGVGGAVVGSAIGEDRDRAEAAAVRRAAYEQDARRAAANTVTVREVIDLTAAGVDPEVICTHVRQRGGCGPPDAGELITLQHNGVDPRVVAALQTAAPSAPARPPRERVIVEQVPVPVPYAPGWRHDPFYDPFCDPHPYRGRRRRCRPEPGVSLGLHFD